MRETTAESLARRRVLVIEDEFFMADDIAAALRMLGAEVVGPVPTQEEAFALLGERPIDVAVLDINLRGQVSYPLADALTERNVPFIFATGYDRSAIPPEYRDVPRWEKPFDPRDLAKILPSLLAGT